MTPTWLNDAIYRDVTLADAKAAFSMSLAALGVAGAASFFGSMPDPDRRTLALTNWGVLGFVGMGVLFAILAIVFAVVTVLPRRYVAKHKDSTGNKSGSDMFRTLKGRNDDGGSTQIDKMYEVVAKSLSTVLGATTVPNAEVWPTPQELVDEIGRLAEVRRRKYWWVGRSITCSALGVVLMIIGVIWAVAVIEHDSRTGGQMAVSKIVSGGQTGADRAALDFAIERGITYGGYVPLGRVDENGPLPARYVEMQEVPSKDPEVRTKMNVEHSDGTVVFSRGAPQGGSLLTVQLAGASGKPILLVDVASVTIEQATGRIRQWAQKNRVKVLNVAGPRASEDQSIYSDVLKILRATFAEN